MTGLRDIYRCEVCGHVVEVVSEGAPTLACCDTAMVKLNAKTGDEGLEKHVPVIEKSDKGIKVKVGSIEHPMTDEHYIKLIEVLTRDKVLRQELKPGDKPEAEFAVEVSDVIQAREFCTLHMLWAS